MEIKYKEKVPGFTRNEVNPGTFLELLARFELATSSLPITPGTSQGVSVSTIKSQENPLFSTVSEDLTSQAAPTKTS